MDAIRLAALDEVRTFELDDSVWAANLAALKHAQPGLSEAIERLAPPDHWRPAAALDGFATYRVERPGDPAAWLDDTAAPRTRASALLAGFRPGENNAALPTFAVGAELQLLLERLPKTQAVFVFEYDLQRLAAVLRLHDLSSAIGAGRCIFVPPDREAEYLEQLLQRRPGLMPPMAILQFPYVAAARVQVVRAVCEQVAGSTARWRLQRLNALGAAAAQRPANEPRLAVLALSADFAAHVHAARLGEAARRLGLQVCVCVGDRPDRVHPLPHCERLVEFCPGLTIAVGHPPQLPLDLPGIVCQWHVRLRDVPETPGDAVVVHLAASPRISDALRSAGLRSERIRNLFWGVAPLAATLDDRPVATDTVLLIGDCPDADPEACGIDQPTHRLLWRTLLEVAASSWESPLIYNPSGLLQAAERRGRVALRDAELRERMLRLVAQVLIPSVVQPRIAAAVRTAGFTPLTMGRGWNQIAEDSLAALGDPLEPRWAALRVRPLAAIFAGQPDRLGPALLEAGALGIPLLLHAPDGRARQLDLGGVLHANQHYVSFADVRDLAAELPSLVRNAPAAAERARAAARHLLDRHRLEHRLGGLVTELGLAWQTG